MTAGNNLENWYHLGSYEREIKLYKELSMINTKIIIFDYASNTMWSNAPLSLKNDLESFGVEVIPLYGSYNGKNKGLRVIKSIVTACMFSAKLTHIKSNQSKGAWLGILLKLKNKNARFLHRSGYSWSDFTFRLSKSKLKYFLTRSIELLTNIFSDEVHVASQLDTRKLFNFELKKIKIVPNWVKVQEFPVKEKKMSSIFIGRLEPQKGITELIDIWPVNESLIVVGDGVFKDTIKQKAYKRGLDLKFIDQLDHGKLMELLSTCKCLVNWSDFEGNPKVILEALFLGVPVIAKNAAGVREIMNCGKFGYMVKDKQDLEKALKKVIFYELKISEVKDVLSSSTFDYTLKQNLKFLNK